MTQNETILNHLQTAGRITQREAIMDHSVQSLTKRISELRDLGFQIESNPKRHPITNQRYVEYRLAA